MDARAEIEQVHLRLESKSGCTLLLITIHASIRLIQASSNFQIWFRPFHSPQRVTGVPGTALPWSDKSTVWLESLMRMLRSDCEWMSTAEVSQTYRQPSPSALMHHFLGPCSGFSTAMTWMPFSGLDADISSHFLL